MIFKFCRYFTGGKVWNCESFHSDPNAVGLCGSHGNRAAELEKIAGLHIDSDMEAHCDVSP